MCYKLKGHVLFSEAEISMIINSQWVKTKKVKLSHPLEAEGPGTTSILRVDSGTDFQE